MDEKNTKQKTWLFSKELKLLTLLALVLKEQEYGILEVNPLLKECEEEINLQLAKIKKKK